MSKATANAPRFGPISFPLLRSEQNHISRMRTARLKSCNNLAGTCIRSSGASTGFAQMLAAIHPDAFAGHGGGALDEEHRRHRHIVGPDAALERKLSLGALEAFLVLLLGEDL